MLGCSESDRSSMRQKTTPLAQLSDSLNRNLGTLLKFHKTKVAQWGHFQFIIMHACNWAHYSTMGSFTYLDLVALAKHRRMKDSTLKTDHSPMLIDRVRKIESLWLYAHSCASHMNIALGCCSESDCSSLPQKTTPLAQLSDSLDRNLGTLLKF